MRELAWRIPPQPSRAPMTGTTTSPAPAVLRTFFGMEKSLFKKLGGSSGMSPNAVVLLDEGVAPPDLSSGARMSPSAGPSDRYV